jgi:tetratricopeptide (TPR) repeat protein
MNRRNRILLAAAAGLVLSGAAVATWWVRRPELTTRSEEARQAFLDAQEDEKRFYWNDARSHVARALQLDPDFAMALLSQAEYERGQGKAERAKNLVDLAAKQLDRVTPTEAYRIRIAVAIANGEKKEAIRILDEFRTRYPNDQWALRAAASRAFALGEKEKGRQLYRDLLEIDPDSADAYNQLGYLAAREGKFAEAEESFAKYAFIGGEQANPHDSLGELLLNIGRYDEAEASLRKALELRPDFVSSTINIALVRRKQGRMDEAEQMLRTLLPGLENLGQRIQVRFLIAVLRIEAGRFDEAARWCEESEKSPDIQPFPRLAKVQFPQVEGQALALAGDLAGAERMLHQAEEAIDEALRTAKKEPGGVKMVEPISEEDRESLCALRARIAATRGDWNLALSELRKIRIKYDVLPFGHGFLDFISLFRYRISVAEALVATGKPGEAAVELAKNLSTDPKDRFTLEELAKIPEPARTVAPAPKPAPAP